MKRLQNKVATSRATLPVTVIYAIVILLASGVIVSTQWLQALCLGVSTFLMVQLNNRNSLIRIYSRLVSCSFLAMCLMCPISETTMGNNLVQLLFISTLLILFDSYQNHHAEGHIFYAFVCLGLISTQFVQIAYFIPILWLLIAVHLQIPSLRCYFASLIGILTPYWFWGAYEFAFGSIDSIYDHILSLAHFGPIAEGITEIQVFIVIIFLLLTGGLSVFNFLQTSYADNIKTRMFYNILMVLSFATLLFVILQPQHSSYLLRIAFVCIAPLIAHYITFTNSWFTNASFLVIVIAMIAIMVLNTWIF